MCSVVSHISQLASSSYATAGISVKKESESEIHDDCSLVVKDDRGLNLLNYL